jgi:hypothetical protein
MEPFNGLKLERRKNEKMDRRTGWEKKEEEKNKKMMD